MFISEFKYEPASSSESFPISGPTTALMRGLGKSDVFRTNPCCRTLSSFDFRSDAKDDGRPVKFSFSCGVSKSSPTNAEFIIPEGSGRDSDDCCCC